MRGKVLMLSILAVAMLSLSVTAEVLPDGSANSCQVKYQAKDDVGLDYFLDEEPVLDEIEEPGLKMSCEVDCGDTIMTCTGDVAICNSFLYGACTIYDEGISYFWSC